MTDFLIRWGASTWSMLVDSGLLLLLGIGLAGLIRAFLSEEKVGKYLKGNGATTVFKAAAFGVPLPLCSCSVLPVAHQLRQSGVSKGGTVAFLISTPESGIDSIALTWSLIDPVMTVARPVTAFLTAFTAGLIENAADSGPEPTPLTMATPKTGCGCGCAPAEDDENQSVWLRLWHGLRYAYTDLISDLSRFLLLGYILAGLVSAVWAIDQGGLPEAFTTGWGAYAGAFVIGLPLYICATSSTPLAAALMSLGFSPGAALVFLMVGPATNIASLVVVAKILKGWAVARYLGSVIIISLLCGLAVDAIYEHFGLDSYILANAHHHADSPAWYAVAAAGILGILILGHAIRRMWPRPA